MDRKEKDELRQKIFDIKENLTEKEAQKLMNLMEEEVKKATHQALYNLEVRYMLDEWLEEEFPDMHDEGEKKVH